MCCARRRRSHASGRARRPCSACSWRPTPPAPARPDFHGVAVTYARVASDPAAGRRRVARHAGDRRRGPPPGEDLAWGRLQRAFAPRRAGCCCPEPRFARTPRRFRGCAMTATGWRCPTSPTPTPGGGRGICRPVAFVTFDGTLSWRSGEDVIESSFETVLSLREASRRYRTAISTELPDGLPRILREADGSCGRCAEGVTATRADWWSRPTPPRAPGGEAAAAR